MLTGPRGSFRAVQRLRQHGQRQAGNAPGIAQQAGSARNCKQRFPRPVAAPGLVQQCEHAVRGGRGGWGAGPDAINVPKGLIAAFREANGRTPNDFEREVIRSTLLNREEQNRFEDAVPRSKFNLFVRYNLKRVGILVAATYYGSVEYKPTNEEQGETFGGKILIDLDIACEVVPGVRLSVGNLLNTFPNEHRKEANIGSRGFLYSRRVTQFGTNGGFYYGRIGLDL